MAWLSCWVMLPAIRQQFAATCNGMLSHQTTRGAERKAAVEVANMFSSSPQGQCSIANASECGDVCTWVELFGCNSAGHISTIHSTGSSTIYTSFSGGSLPASLGQLTQLTSLSLFKNQLTGSLPASLAELTQLTQLDLRCNRLTGFLPALNFSQYTDGCNLNQNYLEENRTDWENYCSNTYGEDEVFFNCPLPKGAAACGITKCH
jgi:hypothetical protein